MKSWIENQLKVRMVQIQIEKSEMIRKRYEHGVGNKPVQVGVVVKPVRQCAGAVQGEALVEHMEGNILKTVVVQRHLRGKIKTMSLIKAGGK